MQFPEVNSNCYITTSNYIYTSNAVTIYQLRWYALMQSHNSNINTLSPQKWTQETQEKFQSPTFIGTGDDIGSFGVGLFFFCLFFFALVNWIISVSSQSHIFSVLPWRPATHGWVCRYIRQRGSGHRQTRRGTGRLGAHGRGQRSSRRASAHPRWSCLPGPGKGKPHTPTHTVNHIMQYNLIATNRYLHVLWIRHEIDVVFLECTHHHFGGNLSSSRAQQIAFTHTLHFDNHHFVYKYYWWPWLTQLMSFTHVLRKSPFCLH